MSKSVSLNPIQNVPPTHDLWSFIQTRKATQSASLKVLQQFVLSLNKRELQHLINIYLKSKLFPTTNPNGTLKDYEQILTNKHETQNPIDKQIMSKMSSTYQQKYFSKFMFKIQQNNNRTRSKYNLLSIPYQILSYSFQYLSYSEMCRVSSVCVCFFYIHKKYHGLTNHYIKLDKTFWYSAMRNRMNLNDLKKFKNIEINYAFLYDKMDKETKLFENILCRIITQSQYHLNALTINVSDRCSFKPFNVLLFIMNNYDLRNMAINKLIIKHDTRTFKTPRNSILCKIKTKIITSFPKLTHFELGINTFNSARLWYDSDERISIISNAQTISKVNKYIISPLIIINDNYNNIYNDLQVLILNCCNGNIFKENKSLLPLLLQNKMQNIRKLSISSSIDSDIACMGSGRSANIKYSPKLEELDLSFIGSRSNSRSISISITNILSDLFSSFVGLNTFIFKNYNNGLESLDWRELFGILCRNKTVYCMNQLQNNNAITPLRSIQLNDFYNYERLKVVLNDILYLRNEHYFDLQHFGIGIGLDISGFGINCSQSFNVLVSFMNAFNVREDSLKSLDFSFQRNPMRFENNYIDPFLKLLSNIPKCLHSIKLTSPYFWWTTPYSRENWIAFGKEIKIKNEESTKLVSKVCEMACASNEKNESQLKSIVLDQFKMSKKDKEYLIFFFGYNDNIFINNNQYWLTLT